MVAAPVSLPLEKFHQTRSREQCTRWNTVGNDTAAWSWPLHTAMILKEMNQTSEQTLLSHFPLKRFLWWDGTTRGDLMTAIRDNNNNKTPYPGCMSAGFNNSVCWSVCGMLDMMPSFGDTEALFPFLITMVFFVVCTSEQSKQSNEFGTNMHQWKWKHLICKTSLVAKPSRMRWSDNSYLHFKLLLVHFLLTEWHVSLEKTLGLVSDGLIRQCGPKGHPDRTSLVQRTFIRNKLHSCNSKFIQLTVLLHWLYST